MNQITCIFLGTGTSQGIPVIGCTCEVCVSNDSKDTRLRCSVLVKIGNTNIVIDTGPDFRQQMLRAGVKKLDAVLITHEHNDHVAGLDDIRPFNFMQKEAINLYASQRVLQQIKSKFHYIFSEKKYPGSPSVDTIIVQDAPFKIDDNIVIPIQYMHGNTPVMGYRIGDFAYLTDIKSIEDAEIEKLKNLSTLVVSSLHHNSHHSHFNLEEALGFIHKVQPQKAYLTHLSHRMGLSKSLKKLLPSHVSVAYDGLELSIS